MCVYFAAVLAGQASSYDIQNPPVVKVESGYVMGFIDGSTFIFLGIPYAQAKRFEPPQKVPALEGVKAAQTYGPICCPIHPYVQNENCMNLNIWTQSLNEDANKPVIVFIHGVAYSYGSSNLEVS